MTDEYIARERALSLAHADSRDIILPAEDVIELAEKYLAFLRPEMEATLLSIKAHLDLTNPGWASRT